MRLATRCLAIAIPVFGVVASALQGPIALAVGLSALSGGLPPIGPMVTVMRLDPLSDSSLPSRPLGPAIRTIGVGPLLFQKFLILPNERTSGFPTGTLLKFNALYSIISRMRTLPTVSPGTQPCTTATTGTSSGLSSSGSQKSLHGSTPTPLKDSLLDSVTIPTGKC